MAARAAWFADNVTHRPLQLAGGTALVILHDWHADGSFEASFDAGATSGSLARVGVMTVGGTWAGRT